MTVLVTGASGHIGAHVVRPTSNLKGLEGLDVEIARGHLRGKPLLITRARARSIVGRYAFYDSSKAQRELGYTARAARIALGEAVRWVQEQAWG